MAEEEKDGILRSLNNKKAEAFVKVLETAVNGTDLSNQYRYAIELQQSLQTQIEQQVVVEKPNLKAISQQELLQKKIDGIEEQISKAGEEHNKGKEAQNVKLLDAENFDKNQTRQHGSTPKSITKDFNNVAKPPGGNGGGGVVGKPDDNGQEPPDKTPPKGQQIKAPKTENEDTNTVSNSEIPNHTSEPFVAPGGKYTRQQTLNNEISNQNANTMSNQNQDPRIEPASAAYDKLVKQQQAEWSQREGMSKEQQDKMSERFNAQTAEFNKKYPGFKENISMNEQKMSGIQQQTDTKQQTASQTSSTQQTGVQSKFTGNTQPEGQSKIQQQTDIQQQKGDTSQSKFLNNSAGQSEGQSQSKIQQQTDTQQQKTSQSSGSQQSSQSQNSDQSTSQNNEQKR
ncbi:MAG: hypothetical protein KF746_23310 [Chitinophagaceae bacterium]|nr:hypothetical protein [Chitinophagaceae bacterium]